MQTREIVVYEKIFEQIYKEKFNINLSFETDKFSEIIQNTNIVIGSFSTAFRKLISKKPYYIYEPERNGLTETELYSNEICSKKFISRDYRDLKKKLLSRNFFSVEKKFFNGNNIDRLDTFFKKL